MIHGISCFIAGLRALLLEAPLRAVLWRMLAVLMLLMLICSASVFFLAGVLIAHYVPEATTWYGELLRGLAWLIASLLALVIGVLTYATLASIALSPWLDDLAARAESPPQQPANVSWQQSIKQSLVHATMPLLHLLPFGLAALPCLLIPVIGVPLATAVWMYGGLRFLAFELMDTPATRRNLVWKQRQQQLLDHRFFYIGLAGVASLMLMIPLVNILVIPAAVVGLSRRMDGNGLTRSNNG